MELRIKEVHKLAGFSLTCSFFKIRSCCLPWGRAWLEDLTDFHQILSPGAFAPGQGRSGQPSDLLLRTVREGQEPGINVQPGLFPFFFFSFLCRVAVTAEGTCSTCSQLQPQPSFAFPVSRARRWVAAPLGPSSVMTMCPSAWGQALGQASRAQRLPSHLAAALGAGEPWAARWQPACSEVSLMFFSSL